MHKASVAHPLLRYLKFFECCFHSSLKDQHNAYKHHRNQEIGNKAKNISVKHAGRKGSGLHHRPSLKPKAKNDKNIEA
jgi:hypothetical protein